MYQLAALFSIALVCVTTTNIMFSAMLSSVTNTTEKYFMAIFAADGCCLIFGFVSQEIVHLIVQIK